MTKEEFYSKALTFDEVGEQVDIFKEEKEQYQREIDRLKKELEIEKDISDGMLETIDKAIEYHNNCIEENLDLDKIDDNEKLAYKVAYEIHNNYLKILKKEENNEPSNINREIN